MKKKIYHIIEKAEGDNLASRIFDNFILLLIFITIIAIILESFDNLAIRYKTQFDVFEVVSVTIFTIEYLLRFWTADIKYPDRNKIMARLAYMISFMALIDLFAILPFYLPMLIPIDLRFLRVLRLTRIFRVFKLNRYSKSLNLIGKVFKETKEELLTTIFLMIFIILIASTMMYYIETEYQPDVFPNIIASFWWSIATLTTVGYGDIYPVTGLGKVLASIIAISGIGIVALPTGIISSGFMRELKDELHRCPKCDHEFKD